jgi:oxygen-dependent protoporphyrinogen oxidase
MMQVTWNTIAGGFWNFTEGVDRLPRAIAERVPVTTDARAEQVRFDENGVEVDVSLAGRPQCLRARGAIVAVPGHRAVPLCPRMPPWLAEPLAATQYTKRVVAHVALRRPPQLACAGYAFPRGYLPGIGALELQHHRAPARCPDRQGMVSVYFDEDLANQGDGELQRRAVEAVEQLFPEVSGATLFVHLLRWDAGTGFFPVGRLRQMIEIRRRLADWPATVEFAGDYLDGVASEGALRSGEQAADRLATKLCVRPASAPQS